VDHINYPNNNTPNNTSRPNYSSQTEFNPAINKGERGYYGNDNKTGHYPNSNRTSDADKRPPNSNLPKQ
jgi:hypothetical protein